MKIPYKCKYCGVPGEATFDGENPDVVYKMDVWKSMLACNRCADYRMDRRKFTDGIKSACIALMQARSGLSGEKLAAKEKGALGALEQLTKRLSAVVCEHYRMTNVWEKEFVSMLLDAPEKWLVIVNHYIKGIAQIKREHASDR